MKIYALRELKLINLSVLDKSFGLKAGGYGENLV